MEQRSGPAAFSHFEGVSRRLQRPPVTLVLPVPGRQPPRLLGELGGGCQRAPGAGALGGLLERFGHIRVLSLHAEGEMPRPLLGVGHELGELPMQRLPLGDADGRIDAGGEQRMSEADAVVFELDHMGLERRRKCVARGPCTAARATSSSVGFDNAEAASSAVRDSVGSVTSRSWTSAASVPGRGSPGSS